MGGVAAGAVILDVDVLRTRVVSSPYVFYKENNDSDHSRTLTRRLEWNELRCANPFFPPPTPASSLIISSHDRTCSADFSAPPVVSAVVVVVGKEDDAADADDDAAAVPAAVVVVVGDPAPALSSRSCWSSSCKPLRAASQGPCLSPHTRVFHSAYAEYTSPIN